MAPQMPEWLKPLYAIGLLFVILLALSIALLAVCAVGGVRPKFVGYLTSNALRHSHSGRCSESTTP